MKIASLLPSCTEIACALDLEDELVGVSHECDFPSTIKSKPILTKSKVNNLGRSDQIDREVINIAKQGLSVYDIYEDKLKELNPDIILTQDQCDVCAVSLKDVQEVTNKYICNANIISLKPDFLNDILNDILTIARFTNKSESGIDLVNTLNSRINHIRNKTKTIHQTSRPKVCCIEWIEPLMIAGNWTPELLEIAGGNSIIGLHGQHTQKTEFKQLLDLQPDKIIIAPCGFKVFQTINDIDFLTSNPDWNKLNAVKNNQVYVIDGNAYLNRPSQRIVDTLEILATIIHPDLFEEKKELGFKLDELILKQIRDK